MKEALITFETAKLAKERGFNVVISYHYDKSGKIQMFTACNDKIDFGYSAPTQSLLQKWLREVQGIDVFIQKSPNGRYYDWYLEDDNSQYKEASEAYQTYEEALEEGLKQAFNLL